MKPHRTVLATVLLLNVADARAETLVSHVGSNNPLTEGFSNPQNSGGVTTGPVFNDQGRAAWSIDSAGASFYYNYTLLPLQASNVTLQGWSLTMNLRVVNVSDPVDFGVYADFASPAGIYQMGFGTQADGDPIIQLITDSAPLVFSLETGGNTYHTYEIRYNPLANAADLRVDGVVRISGWQGRAANPFVPPQSNFGSFSNPGHANWNEFTFAVVPEPSSAVLLALGCSGVALIARRRKSGRSFDSVRITHENGA